MGLGIPIIVSGRVMTGARLLEPPGHFTKQPKVPILMKGEVQCDFNNDIFSQLVHGTDKFLCCLA